MLEVYEGAGFTISTDGALRRVVCLVLAMATDCGTVVMFRCTESGGGEGYGDGEVAAGACPDFAPSLFCYDASSATTDRYRRVHPLLGQTPFPDTLN